MNGYSNRMLGRLVDQFAEHEDDHDRVRVQAQRILDAAHDRKRLGLEASVHAASFLDEIVTKLWEWDGIPEAERRKAVAFLLREFASEAIGATDDQ